MMALLDYLRLTCPGITLMVMLTGFTGMWLASRGMAEPSLFLWGIVGIGLASAGASIFNNYYDRDIDVLMKRTRKRPLPEGRIKPTNAFVFGILLSLLALTVLVIFVNSLSAFLTALSIFIYSYLYTVILKRRTSIATEIGGISGALPPLIGWTAIRGHIDFEAILLFVIIFLWQPPHFWSLASRYREDYKITNIPVLPVISDSRYVILRSMLYISALIFASILPYLTGMADRDYLFIILMAGLLYMLLYLVAILTRKDLNKYLFLYSLLYLSLCFVLLLVNRTVTP